MVRGQFVPVEYGSVEVLVYECNNPWLQHFCSGDKSEKQIDPPPKKKQINDMLMFTFPPKHSPVNRNLTLFMTTPIDEASRNSLE